MIAQTPVKKPVKVLVRASRLTTFIGDVVVEEDAWNAASGMHALLVTFCGVRATHEGALVRGDGVLVSFNAAL